MNPQDIPMEEDPLMKALDSSVSIWLRIAMYVTAVFFLNFFGAVSIELMVNCSKVLTGRWCLNHTSPLKLMAILGTTKYIVIYTLQRKFYFILVNHIKKSIRHLAMRLRKSPIHLIHHQIPAPNTHHNPCQQNVVGNNLKKMKKEITKDAAVGVYGVLTNTCYFVFLFYLLHIISMQAFGGPTTMRAQLYIRPTTCIHSTCTY